MANVRFVWDNVAGDTSSLTATSSAGDLLPANMQADERDAVWRSTSLAAQTIDFRWAADQSVDSICLAWTNLSAAATVQCKGYTVEAGDSGQVFDETVSPDTGLTIGNVTVQNWIDAAYDIKHLKIVITDAANPDGYMEISRAVIGARISPVNNASYNGYQIEWVEQSEPVRAESRDLRVDPLGRFRRLQMRLDNLEPASRDNIIDMVANGLGRGVWVSTFPDSSSATTRQMNSFWGALVQKVPWSYPLLDVWDAPLVFEEMG